jgi:formylglycine-generating enzyme required for sulfatase activity
MPNDTANFNSLSQNVNLTVTSGLIEMVYVEGGRFMYGRCAQTDPTGGTLTDVSSFFIGKYQVTQDQWREVMTDNSNGINVNPSGFSSNPAAGEVQERRPVERITWYDVLVFCNRLSIREGLTPAYEMQTAANTNVWSSDPDTWGATPVWFDARWVAVRIIAGSRGYRLPTEHQWEFAAKGGRNSASYTGTASDTYFIWSGSNNVNDVGWHRDNSGNKTREVGRLAPNELGLYDMSGNVNEWCWTTNLTIGYALGRGGSWCHLNDAQSLRSVYRIGFVPHNRHERVGFRLVRP